MDPVLIPFDTLPACVKDCGPLYDVNGACVPPAKPASDAATYASCFCRDSRLAALNNNPPGVCDKACAADPSGLTAVHNWFASFCANANKAAPTAGGTGPTTTSGSTANQNKGGGDWISTHWQWVIFIVVIVLGIIGIWVGACVWRRRYLRKKDLQYALGKSMTTAQAGGAQSSRSVHLPQAGFFAPASISTANVYETEKMMPSMKKERKKWIVSQRT